MKKRSPVNFLEEDMRILPVMVRKGLRAILLLFFTGCSVFSLASDYYWIGGKGSWSDISHWSTASGGVPGYTVIPGTGDNVIFDANSFSGSGDTVFMPQIAFCKDFNFQSTHAVAFEASAYWPSLNIHGDLKLPSGIDFRLNTFVFSNGYNNQFDIEGAVIHFLTLRGNGDWVFPDYAWVGSFYLSQGKVLINADSFSIDMYMSEYHYGAYKTRIDIESPFCRLARFQMDDDTFVSTKSVLYDLGGITTFPSVYVRMGRVHTNSVYPGVAFQNSGCIINRLYCEKQDFLIYPTNGTIDTLTVSEGRSVEFSILGPVNIGRIEAQGTCLKPISFMGASITTSTVQGVQSADINYASFRYLNFSNPIQANNSIDVISNTGITFMGSTAYQTFYWIGGRGNYEDPSHWSLSSGGSAGSCTPREGDTIVFDANSFNQADTVFFPGEIRAGGLRISTDKVYFKSQLLPSNIFNLYGNAHLTQAIPGMANAHLYFFLNQNAELQASGSYLESIILWTVGKELTLKDNTLTIHGIHVRNGILNLDDRVVNCHTFDIGSLQNTQISMVNTVIRTKSFGMSVFNGSLDATGSEVYVSGSFGASGSNVFLPYVKIFQDSSVVPDIYINDSRYGQFVLDGTIQMRSINAQADTFVVMPGSLLRHNTSGGRFQVNERFEADAPCNERILLHSGAYQFSPSTQVVCDNVDFYDITMFGQTGIVAQNSSLMHFCGGFNVNNGPSKKYWIGGQGNWQDPLHWSSQSGGASISCVPSYNDTVVFDQNSFSSDYDTVFLDSSITASCAFFDARDLSREAVITAYTVPNSVQFFYVQFGAFLSPKLHGNFGGGMIQNGAEGSWFDLNNFSGPHFPLRVSGRGVHEVYGTSDSMYLLHCENGETRLYAPDFTTWHLHLGDDVSTANMNYPYARLVIPAHSIVRAAEITVEGLGRFIADSAIIYSTGYLFDTRGNAGPLKFARFIAESETDPIKRHHPYSLFANLQARAIVLRRSLVIMDGSLLETDTFLVSGARYVHMYSGSGIQADDHFFAVGNNCQQVSFQGSGITPTIASNSADFNCDHLIIQEVAAVGNANFFAGTYSQLSGNTGDWVQGTNPNLVTRMGATPVVACDDSVLVDMYPFHGAADSVQVNGTRSGFESWFSDTGAHIIEAFYDNHCSIFDTVYISLPDMESMLLPSDTLFCGIDSMEIVPVAELSAPWQWVWNDNSTGDSLTVKTSGTYWLELSQPGCVRRDSVNVYLGRKFEEPAFARDTFYCFGDSLHVTLRIPAGYPVEWTDSDTARSRFLKGEGTYHYTIRDSTCASQDSIVAEEISIQVMILGDSSFCQGDSIQLNAGITSGQLSWQSGANQAAVWAPAGGIYWLSRTDSGCTVRDSHEVIMQAVPVITITGDTLFCQGDSIPLNVQSDVVSWEWTDWNTDNPRWVSQAGQYNVIAEDQNCVSKDSLPVYTEVYPDLNLRDSSFCPGEQLKLPLEDISNAAEVTMNGIVQNDTVIFAQAGQYIFEVSNGSCLLEDTLLVALNAPILYSVADSFDICELKNQVFILSLDTPYTYLWNGEPLLSGEIEIGASGMERLTVLDQHGCSISQNIYFYTCACEQYFPSAITVNGDLRNETFGGTGCDNLFDYRLQVYNRWGQLIFESTDPAVQWDGTHMGIACEVEVYLYLVSYSDPNGRYHKKGTLTILR